MEHAFYVARQGYSLLPKSQENARQVVGQQGTLYLMFV